MSSTISIQTNNNVTEISGDLPFDVRDMIPVQPYESFINVRKVSKIQHAILPENIDWSKVDRNSWFICIHPDNYMNYSFPIAESENRDNDFVRAKNGIAYFHAQNYQTYSIGS